MKRPTLGELAELGQVVGALGVILSLIYVGAELRQNTQALRAQTFQQQTATSIELLSNFLHDDDFVRFYVKAALAPDSLDLYEQGRWTAVMLGAYRHFENLHYQYRSGLLEPEMWKGYDQIIRGYLALPGWTRWWEPNQIVFSDEFRAYIATVLESPRQVRPTFSAPPVAVQDGTRAP